MTKAQLLEVAEEKEVEGLSLENTKAEIIAALESAGEPSGEDGLESSENDEPEVESQIEDFRSTPGWKKAYDHAVKHNNPDKAARQYADTYFKDFA